MKSDIITKPNHGELSLVDNIFSEKEVADIYGICTRTLSNLRKKQILKVNEHYFFVGNQIRYYLNKVQGYFELESKRKLQQQ
tara:strand:+ start:150 stop:395 length:246 start_codon:yes stop_codon:yes gene_type:complete